LKKILLSTVVGLAVSLSSVSAQDCIMVEDLNVEFKNASTVYSNNAEYQEVKDFANFLKKTDLYAVIEGHTNSKANARYNYDLSTKRAVKVRQEMIKLGVSPSHIRAMGFGESSPLYDNNTEEGLLKNRRVIAEVFNSAQELNDYIKEQKNRIKPIIYKEQ
jgi:outer membrane protein OmpA-like peptidoglycan-associated protein